jgi:hypothetical protein
VEDLEETREAKKSDPAGGPFLKCRGMTCERWRGVGREKRRGERRWGERSREREEEMG